MPVALTIAGSDSGGGAGIQADLKTFHSLGCFGTSAVTCVTAQNLDGVSHVEALSTHNIAAQIDAVFAGFPVKALKTGMLFSAEIIETVFRQLAGVPVPIVVDPVMVSRAGSVLVQPDAISAYEKLLFRRAAILTPNCHEAAVLLQENPEQLDLKAAAASLWRKYSVPVVVKGLLKGGQKIDFFCDTNGVREISGKYISEVNTHGTGCTFSAAIAAFLAQGENLFVACEKSKARIIDSLTNLCELEGGPKVLGTGFKRT